MPMQRNLELHLTCVAADFAVVGLVLVYFKVVVVVFVVIVVVVESGEVSIGFKACSQAWP